MLPSDILEKGWIKYKLFNKDKTRFCILGAVEEYHRVEKTFIYHQMYVALTNEISATGWEPKNTSSTDVAKWNDRKASTQAEVVALVRRAEIACGLRPKEDPEQWDIPVQPVEVELQDPQVEPVLAQPGR